MKPNLKNILCGYLKKRGLKKNWKLYLMPNASKQAIFRSQENLSMKQTQKKKCPVQNLQDN